MKALAYVVEHDPGIFISRQSETNVISIAVSRHAATFAGIANIAEVVQLSF
jgi:regulator of PEP synthase PpsR (kinase-PPPase family)